MPKKKNNHGSNSQKTLPLVTAYVALPLNDAVREALAEDAEDIAAFDERVKEMMS